MGILAQTIVHDKLCVKNAGHRIELVDLFVTQSERQLTPEER